MVTIFGCILHGRNLWRVSLAGLLCGAGSSAAARRFQRMVRTSGNQRLGRHAQKAMSAGVAIWCTHFVAMPGFEVNAPVTFGVPLTVLLLFIAVGGTAPGFVLAGSRTMAAAPALGGALIGIAIALMHHTGPLSWRVDGIVSRHMPYVMESVVPSIVLFAVALHLAMRPVPQAVNHMIVTLSLAIRALHFMGAAALHVTALPPGGIRPDPGAMRTLALAVAGMSLVIACTGLVISVIDSEVRAESLEHLRRMAPGKLLTGWPNRTGFNDRLGLEIGLTRERETRLALVGIGLNASRRSTTGAVITPETRGCASSSCFDASPGAMRGV